MYSAWKLILKISSSYLNLAESLQPALTLMHNLSAAAKFIGGCRKIVRTYAIS